MEEMQERENTMYHLAEDNMKIIDNYRDLPIGMYLDICDIDRRTDIEEINKQVMILAMLSGESEDAILNLPLEEYKELVIKSNYLRTPYDGEVLTAKSYKIGEWHLIPVQDFRKITTAQYIDFQTFSKEGEKRIVELLSTMLVPTGKKYNQDYDVIELQNTLRIHLSVADALSLLAFFFVLFSQSIVDTLTFCKEVAAKMPKEQREIAEKQIQNTEAILKRGGDGSHV